MKTTQHAKYLLFNFYVDLDLVDFILDFHDFALACDLKIKDGVLSEEEALDWLIIEMSS